MKLIFSVLDRRRSRFWSQELHQREGTRHPAAWQAVLHTGTREGTLDPAAWQEVLHTGTREGTRDPGTQRNTASTALGLRHPAGSFFVEVHVGKHVIQPHG